MKELPSKVIIIGAGPSGLFAARELQDIAKKQHKKIEIVLLEKESEVGGKCHTFSDPDHPELKTEWGATVVAANYGVVLDAIEENKIELENLLPIAIETIEIKQEYNKKSFLEKIAFMNDLRKEISTFNSDYDVYKLAKHNKKELPDELKKPFNDYAQLRKMKYLPIFIKPFVPGFGYGALTHCPTYSVLEYLGKTTIPELVIGDNLFDCLPLLPIHGGFESLMESMAKKFDVRLNSTVSEIKRESNKVTVKYQQNGKEYIETADELILATTPKNWESLGLDLNSTEKKCIEQLECYTYPVAVYKIKGFPPKQVYFQKALEESGFGHLALISTRDNRNNPEDGRLCTIYINLPPNQKDYKFDHDLIKKEIRKQIEEVTDITVLEEKLWKDYMPTLPWETRVELHKAQSNSNTIYLGAHTLGAFEDVVCVAHKAVETLREQYTSKVTYEDDFSLKNVNRFFKFITAPVQDPYNADKSLRTKEL